MKRGFAAFVKKRKRNSSLFYICITTMEVIGIFIKFGGYHAGL